MRNRGLNILCLFASLAFVQCWTEVPGDEYAVGGGNAMYLQGVIEAGEYPEISVLSAVEAYGSVEPDVLTNEDLSARIIYTTAFDGSQSVNLYYNSDTKSFSSQDIVIAEDVNYDISIESSNPQLYPSTYAETNVPTREEFEKIEILEDLSYPIEPGILRFIYEVNLEFEEESLEKYFLIKPVDRVIGIDSNEVSYTPYFNDYNVIEVLNLQSGINITPDFNAVLVNTVDNPDIKNIELNIALKNKKRPQNELHHHVYFELWNISEELYKYYLSGGYSTEYNQTSFIEPIVEFTNVENGFGIFGGAAIKLDSIAIPW